MLDFYSACSLAELKLLESKDLERFQMKICILTQPLHKNYGGHLQAYALQKYLKDIGHEVITADIPFKKPRFFSIPLIAKSFLKKYVLKRNVGRIIPLSKSEISNIQQNTDKFKKKYISLTRHISSVSKINRLNDYKFDAFVVGSDQVWRPTFSPGILTYFLDFLSKNNKVKKISYAASFGVDNCNEFSENDKSEIKRLLAEFDFVSVREDSGVALCQKEFNVIAHHVIDPTLLLTSDDYRKLVESEKTPKHSGNLFGYILDKSDEKNSIIEKVEISKGLNSFNILPDNINSTFPPVEAWLRGFIDAEYIVTDSFHGVVFSLLFNKPFIAIANEGRGVARFTSLLKMFNLESRLILSIDELNEKKINESIDFNIINELINKERTRVFGLIVNALK